MWMTQIVWVRVALALCCTLHSAAQEQEATVHELNGNTAHVPRSDSEQTRSEPTSAPSLKNSHWETHTFPLLDSRPRYPPQVPRLAITAPPGGPTREQGERRPASSPASAE